MNREKIRNWIWWNYIWVIAALFVATLFLGTMTAVGILSDGIEACILLAEMTLFSLFATILSICMIPVAMR
jgi:hypothetical protein